MSRVRGQRLTLVPFTLVVALVAALVLTFASGGTPVAHAVGGGPVILMGVDGDDIFHAPAGNYKSLVDIMLTNVSNAGSDILVIGGGKSGTDDVTTFWNGIASQSSMTPTYVNGAAAITNQSFAGFALIAVVSDVTNTPGGGLTNAENTALSGRSADIATHVNAEGGLMGFSSCSTTDPYGYLGGVGAVTCTSASYTDIVATTAGTAAGVSDALEGDAWHDVYETFPSFLVVLATAPTVSGKAAVIGGSSVTIVPEVADTATPVPGVGTTGLVALAVAMVVAGSIYYRRRAAKQF
jgi:hypothetical protein